MLLPTSRWETRNWISTWGKLNYTYDIVFLHGLESNYLTLIFVLRNLSNVFADWVKTRFVLKMEFLMRFTAKLLKSFPRIRHQRIIVQLLHAVTIKLPAQTVNAHFPTLEIYHLELLVSPIIVTQVTTRKLSSRWWILFENIIFQWIRFLLVILSRLQLLIIFSWLLMSSLLKPIVSIPLELQ